MNSLQIGFSKPKQTIISKEQKCYAEKTTYKKYLTTEFWEGLRFNKSSPGKSASQGKAFGTDNFNPHWRFLHLWKITLQRDEHCL